MQIIARYTEIIMKRPIVTLVILAIITVALGSGLRKLQFDTSVETFLPSTDPQYVFYKSIKQIYGDIDTFVILVTSPKNLWSREAFAEINNFLSDIEEYQDYDKDREKGRIEKLSAYLGKGAIKTDDLMGDFKDDPGFARFIQRKLKKAGVDGQTTIPQSGLNSVYKQALRLQPFKEMKIIHKIISPFTIKDIIGTEDTLRTIDLIAEDGNGNRILPETSGDFETLKARLRRNPIFDKGIYGKNSATGEITDLAFVIRFSTDSTVSKQDAVSREILDIVDNYKNLNITAQGQPLIYAWINDYIREDLFNLVPLSLLVVTIILFINFRTFRGVALPFTTLVMALIWVLGLMGHLGVKITQLCTSLPPLIICVGSAYAIHVLNQYYEDLESIKKKGLQKGLIPSMSYINTTVSLAGITTIISFWTLANHKIPGLRTWGIFTGVGVMFAVIIAMTLIPPCLALIPHKRHFLPGKKKVAGAHIDLVAVLIKWLTRAALHHNKMVLVVFAFILGFSIIGVFKLKVETELLQYFKEDNPIRVSDRFIGEKFGGRWGFNILIDSGEPDGVKKSEYLNTLERIRAWLESDENKSLNVGRTDGFPDYIRTMHMAMNNDDPKFFAIPESDTDIADYLEIYSDDDENSDGRADSYEPYVDTQFQTCNLLTRLCQKQDHLVGTEELKIIFGKIKEYLAQTLPKNYSFSITGHPMLFIQSADYISGGQLQSLFQSMAVISLVIFFLIRNILAGFLALIPLGVAVTLNFGLMGWLGIPLDVATSVIAAITIGIGDDVTIHFINTWRHLRQRGYSLEDSIRETLLESGRANIYSALALMCGCSVFIISTFKPIVLFGILMLVVIAANNIGALLILPSVIQIIKFDIKPGKKSKKAVAA